MSLLSVRRLAFVIHPKLNMSTAEAGDGQNAADHDDVDIEPIWCHLRVPSTTTITETKTLSEKWSL